MPLEDLIKPANRDNYDPSVARSMPLYPGISLTTHVALKNMQVGSSLGSVIALGAWLRKPGMESFLLHKWPRYAAIGAGVSLLPAAAMMAFKMQTIDLEGLEDRAYRIRHNKMVRGMDWFGVGGAMAMVVVGVGMRRFPGAARYYPLGHACQGLAAGTIAFAVSKAAGLPVDMEAR